jgi:gliding motility-associated-like protein
VTVTVDTVHPIVSIVSSGNLTCNDSVITLTGNTNITHSFSWIGGNIISGGNTLTPQIDSAAIYYLTIQDTINGCLTTASVTVLDNTDPANDPTGDCDGDGVSNEDEINNGTDPFDTDSDDDGLSDYEEFTGIDDPTTPLVPTSTSDGTDPCDPNPTIFPELCDDNIYVPNIFTPNNDGSNDMFLVRGNTIQTLKCQIINRWGQIVYEWDTPQGGWDGTTIAGEPSSSGTYYYLLEVTKLSGENVIMNGHFQLVRE